VKRRAAKLKADYLVQGKREGGKLAAAMEICEKEGISLDEVAYIGDDVNCMELLEAAGYPFCPQDASAEVRKIGKIKQLMNKGGDGVFREAIENLNL
jgi:N-acylneuraminate cytidylyltransferase